MFRSTPIAKPWWHAVERFGRLDVLVNNAGIGSVGKLAIEDWRRMLAVDLDGVFYCVRAALPHLVAARGVVVNLAFTNITGANLVVDGGLSAQSGAPNHLKAFAAQRAGRTDKRESTPRARPHRMRYQRPTSSRAMSGAPPPIAPLPTPT